MMKNSALFFMAAWCLLLCSSCEKPVIDTSSKGEESPKAHLTLHIGGFNVIPYETSRSTDQLSAYCTRLNFVLYQEGKKVKAVNQEVQDADFGMVDFAVNPGTYQVLVLAHSATGNPTLSNPEKIQFTNKDGYTDTFYAYTTISVNEGNQAEEMVLDRITSMFRFITKDNVPDDVASIRFYYTGGSGALDATTGFGCVNSQQVVFYDITDEMKGKPLQLETYTIPKSTTGTLKMIVSAYDQDTTVLYEKEIDNIPIEVNKITEYSGFYFTNNTESPDNNEDDFHASTIRLNTEWNGTLNGSF